MDFNLTPEQQQFRDAVSGFAQKHLKAGALKRAHQVEHPFDVAKLMAEQGLMGIAFPESDGGWRIVYERMRFAELTGDRDRDVLRITAETTALLERRIRERPELWLWMHRRWKTPAP